MSNAPPHSIITCVPLIGLLLGMSMVVTGRCLASHPIMRAGLWSLTTGGLVALGLRLTGASAATPQADVPHVMLPSAIMAGVVSGWALLMDRRGHRIARMAAVTFTAPGAGGSLAWSAWCHSAPSPIVCLVSRRDGGMAVLCDGQSLGCQHACCGRYWSLTDGIHP